MRIEIIKVRAVEETDADRDLGVKRENVVESKVKKYVKLGSS